MKKEETVRVIEIKDGLGQAFFTDDLDRKPIYVPFSLPGDIARIEPGGKRKGKRLGYIIDLIEKSSDRIPSRCLHFTRCGGCQLQHVPEKLQLMSKEQKIRMLFASFLHQESIFYPIIPSPSIWKYRNKMEYTFSEDKQGQKFLGLLQYGSSKRVISLQECHLVSTWFVDTIKATLEWWQKTSLHAYRPNSNSGSLRTLTVREGITTGDKCVILTVSGDPTYALKRKELEDFCRSIQGAITLKEDAFLTVVVRIQQAIKGQPTQFFEMKLAGPEFFREEITIAPYGSSATLELWISPSSFFQPNTQQAAKLYETVIALSKLSIEDVVYDLYCGTGTFGLFASLFAQKVFAIELSPDSVYDAKENAKRLLRDNFFVIQGDVAEVIAKRDMPLPNVVIIDPPRSGLTQKARESIISLAPQKCVYVSCNPVTQAEDIAYFYSQGYRVDAIQPIEQFSHTIHVENVVLLKKNDDKNREVI